MAVRRALAAALVALAAVQVVTVGFVHPPQATLPRRADAVVVLSGDHGDRLALGLALVAAGRAPTLVILRPSDGPSARSLPLSRAGAAGGAEVVCADPAVVSTRGDGRFVRRLSRERGWDEVVVVTSRFHGRRSKVLLSRCVDADVTVAVSRPELTWRTWVAAIVHEAGGLAEALVVRRGC